MKEVYVKSWQDAAEQNEIEKWRESREIFRSCRSDMDMYETGISATQNPKEMRIVLEALSIKWRYERIMLIMARTVQSRTGDGRFDRQIREWAEAVDLTGKDNLIPTSEAHSAMLNYALRDLLDKEFIKQVMHNEKANIEEVIEADTAKNPEENTGRDTVKDTGQSTEMNTEDCIEDGEEEEEEDMER